MLRHVKLMLTAAVLIAGAGIAASAQAAQIGAYTTHGAYSYVSAPKLHPPVISADVRAQGKLAPGDFLVASFPNLTLTEPATGAGVPLTGQSGPLILDSHLQSVWFDPVPTDVVALDLKEQSYQGKPVLSWWQGALTKLGAAISGAVEVVDQHYRKVGKTIVAKPPWVISEHEAAISGPDIWVTVYRDVPIDLTKYGGMANGVLYDAGVQEYDLKTGQLVSTWDALDHIALSQSQTRPSPVPAANGTAVAWDAYHVNSVQLTGHGTFLVSMRNTWSAYLVNQGSGAIEWTLSGVPELSNFTLPSNGTFAWQHDVELHADDVVSMFDDSCCAVLAGGKFGAPSGPSHGLVLKLNMATHSASFVARYGPLPAAVTGLPGAKLNSAFLGNTQLLADGNVAVGWGSEPFFSEYSKAGRLLFDARWPAPDLSYRAYVQQWVGEPFFAPSGGARTSHGKTILYASWDGATQVSRWRFLAGPDPSRLPLVATKPRSGFETSVTVTGIYKWFRVQAANAKGQVIGTSKAFGGVGSATPGSY